MYTLFTFCKYFFDKFVLDLVEEEGFMVKRCKLQVFGKQSVE